MSLMHLLHCIAALLAGFVLLERSDCYAKHAPNLYVPAATPSGLLCISGLLAVSYA